MNYETTLHLKTLFIWDIEGICIHGGRHFVQRFILYKV